MRDSLRVFPSGFSRSLQGVSTLIAGLRPQPGGTDQLSVFVSLPTDQRNNRAQGFFGAPRRLDPRTSPPSANICEPEFSAAGPRIAVRWRFVSTPPLHRLAVGCRNSNSPAYHVTLRLQIARKPDSKPTHIRFLFLDDAGWSRWSAIVAADGTRVGGLRRAMQMTREATGLSDLTLVASGGPVVLALHAPALKDSPPAVELHHLPPTFRDKSNLMNGVRMIDTDHVLELLGKVTHVTVK